MSFDTVMKVAFLAKAPRDCRELRRILNLADQVMAKQGKRQGQEETSPTNVIPFDRSEPRRKVTYPRSAS